VGQGAAGVDFMLSTGRMPLRGGENDVDRHAPAYDRATIEALVEYVSTLVPGGPAIPDVDAAAGDLTGGGTQYRAQCAACHQSALQGGALVRGSSPDLEQATAVQVGEAMRTGPGAMPVFGSAAASDHDVDSIARYVLALQHPDDPGGQPLWHLGPLPEGAVAFVALGLVIVALRRIGTRT
jgi:ubiquinol-cytochrome c reductase cytochrome c subunit